MWVSQGLSLQSLIKSGRGDSGSGGVPGPAQAHKYRADIIVLRNANFCVGCFELYLRKIFATAPKIGGKYFMFTIFSPAEFIFADLLLVD